MMIEDDDDLEAHDIIQGPALLMCKLKNDDGDVRHGISGMQIVLWLDGLNASQKLD